MDQQVSDQAKRTATAHGQVSETRLRGLIAASENRLDLWVSFVGAVQARDVAEIGVYRGAFAESLLRECPEIRSYYMVDPWRHLDDWNKPSNKADDVFERFFAEAMARTEAYADKRVVLRGRTSEVIDQVPDGALDFAYVDGDHTLRGVTIDLVKTFPKIRDEGWIGGDDFCRSIWQHEQDYEPTLVFPFAIYFAEAVGARVFALPYNQFLIQKTTGDGYEFTDFTGKYGRVDLRSQFAPHGERGPRAVGTRGKRKGSRGGAKRAQTFASRLRRRLRG